MTDYPDLEKLKTANESLRELGLDWLRQSLQEIVSELNQSLFPGASEGQIVVAAQGWSFEIDRNVMQGERIGVRYRVSTLLVEIGWPRLPEQGIVPDLGLARARISLSPNITIDPVLITELTLWRYKAGDSPVWKVTGESGEEITHQLLEGYVRRILAD